MQTTLTHGEKTVWINLPLSPELRKRIKVTAAEREQTAREFILDAVNASLEKGRPGEQRTRRAS